jgi:oligosaccharide reducing-end xylanase
VTFKARWDEHHLHLLVSVSDPTRSRGDRVEVFVDENNDKATSYGPDDAAYALPPLRGRPPPGPLPDARTTRGL